MSIDIKYAKQYIRCNCGHLSKYHFNGEGCCVECGCTWYHPNDRWLKKQKRTAHERIEFWRNVCGYWQRENEELRKWDLRQHIPDGKYCNAGGDGCRLLNQGMIGNKPWCNLKDCFLEYIKELNIGTRHWFILKHPDCPKKESLLWCRPLKEG